LHIENGQDKHRIAIAQPFDRPGCLFGTTAAGILEKILITLQPGGTHPKRHHWLSMYRMLNIL
jgi:hypothetical protein